ncbi:hypothetical protein B0H16DRAFT_1574865 [Mycena metata]|uniref:Uncharacterized protein n=1 Tax=Mycena metata TaxID=1033252 RepID=A0AAD7MWE8_9AGAR|nr:hypothetical protein B0H16DRAFT_1574865 [Mycena metata]
MGLRHHFPSNSCFATFCLSCDAPPAPDAFSMLTETLPCLRLRLRICCLVCRLLWRRARRSLCPFSGLPICSLIQIQVVHSSEVSPAPQARVALPVACHHHPWTTRTAVQNFLLFCSSANAQLSSSASCQPASAAGLQLTNKLLTNEQSLLTPTPYERALTQIPGVHTSPAGFPRCSAYVNKLPAQWTSGPDSRQRFVHSYYALPSPSPSLPCV